MSDLDNKIKDIVYMVSDDGSLHIDINRRRGIEGGIEYTAVCNLKSEFNKPGSATGRGTTLAQAIAGLRRQLPKPEPLPNKEI